MKKIIPAFLRSLLFSGLFLLMSASSYASHIIGAELRYKWMSGLTYQVTVVLYGDCSSTSGVFFGLPVSRPVVCIYNANSSVASITLNIDATTCGTEITPVCPDSLSYTTCHGLSYTIPGVTKFVYNGTYTFPSNQKYWRLIYTGDNSGAFGSVACSFFTGSTSAGNSGRSALITNINTGSGGYSIQLIDTLNTLTSRGHNSSPVLTVEPTPYFCAFYQDCYNPGASDIYDTSAAYHEPSGDSMIFTLVTPTNGNGSCSSIGGPATYLIADAWTVPTVQPMNGAHPLQCTDGTTFNFDSSTGQLCFTPITQRSTVVYNIDEYLHDTLVGSMQREMNFYVRSCVLTDPAGNIDSSTGSGTVDTSRKHFTACQYSGDFTLIFHPSETDTAGLQITITATGLVAGVTFAVTGNGTSTPRGVLIGNTNVMAPGNYTIYITYTDNRCPLVGSHTVPVTIIVLPVPTITFNEVVLPTCTSKAQISIIPGGTGKPWDMYISIPPGGIAADTLVEHTDTASWLDSLAPANYHLTIFTSASRLCSVDTLINIPFAKFHDTLTTTNPLYCGSPTGSIILQSLLPGSVDSVAYQYNTVWQPHIGFIVTTDSTDTVSGLMAGVYDNIYVIRGYCHSDTIGPRTLANPPFTVRGITFTNPSKFCACDGTDTIYGLHPGQLDSILYLYTPPGGSPTLQPLTIRFISGDSIAYMTGLCAGAYSDFVIRTDSVCSTTIFPATNIGAPKLIPNFDTTTIYGCSIDTVQFTNRSTPTSVLTYKWDFGDGTTDTVLNPRHPYYSIVGQIYTVTLTVSDGICDSSLTETVNLNSYIKSAFTFAPDPYACQGSVVTFTDNSTGMGKEGYSVLSYLWSFGDGNSSNSFDATNVFQNTGTYSVRLVVGNNIPCFDTSYGTIVVDSISTIVISSTDSVICRGSGINFTGLFTTIGDTLTTWSFGDGNTIYNVNPVLHAYDDTGSLTVTLNALYRACPATRATRTMRIYRTPDLYLGPDTAICTGGQPILLNDDRNSGNGKAKWLWNSGEKTSGIVVTKPGTYVLTVTLNGCSSSDTVFVANDCYLGIPNIFTPNNDGVNDYFFPRQLLTSGLTAFKMNVYNRWGQEVYETTNIEGRGWDGNFNNVAQPEGVYIYIIDATLKDGITEHHQGNITLLR